MRIGWKPRFIECVARLLKIPVKSKKWGIVSRKKKWEEHILYDKEKWGIASEKEEHILNGKENGANISQIVPFLPFMSFFIGLSTSQDTGQMFKFTFLTFSNWVLFCFKHRCKKLPNSKHIKKSIFMLTASINFLFWGLRIPTVYGTSKTELPNS